MKFIDMHTHSTASDGIYSPSKLVDYAFEKGLSGIAITDHDTTSGIEEAIAQAAKYDDFIIIPGVELSTEYNGEEVHILGYMIDYKMEHLVKMFQTLQKVRNERAIKIIDKLNRLGIEINYEDILGITKGNVIGRPHIARYLSQKNYVETTEEAFGKYLARGALAYVPKHKLTPEDAIDIIKKANGISVAAHPGLLKNQNVLKYLINIGIGGIEVYHSDHTKNQSMEYLDLSRKHNLLVTGGSDFHSPPGYDNFHGDLGNVKVSLKSIESIFI